MFSWQIPLSDYENGDDTDIHDTYTLVLFEALMQEVRRPRQQLLQPLRCSGRPGTPPSRYVLPGPIVAAGMVMWKRQYDYF